jgi:hypothetical protein
MATSAAPPPAPPLPRLEQCAPRPLGSQFWSLAEDSSDDEGSSPAPPPSASPVRRPAQVTVGDFICSALGSPVAPHNARGRRQAFASGAELGFVAACACPAFLVLGVSGAGECAGATGPGCFDCRARVVVPQGFPPAGGARACSSFSLCWLADDGCVLAGARSRSRSRSCGGARSFAYMSYWGRWAPWVSVREGGSHSNRAVTAQAQGGHRSFARFWATAQSPLLVAPS